jgi:hypothetical protein
VDRTDLDEATSRGPVEGLAVVPKVVAEVDAALDVGRTVRTGERNLGRVARSLGRMWTTAWATSTIAWTGLRSA